MEIGKNIRFRRKQLKMTQEQLALEVNSDAGNLSRIESGKQNIPIDKIILYARALRCQVSDLLSEATTLPNTDQLPVGLMRIPFISFHEATKWSELRQHKNFLNNKEWLVVSSEISIYSFALRIDNDRNFPDLKINDVVIIDPEISPQPGDFVLVTIQNEQSTAILGKYRSKGVDTAGVNQFEIYPINNDFNTLHSEYQYLTIIGVVIEHRRNLKK